MFEPKDILTVEDIQELYVVTHIDNISSILDKHLLSHHLAKDIEHRNISNHEVQDIRSKKPIFIEQIPEHTPEGESTDSKGLLETLWDYVCMFIQPYNAMLFTTRHEDVCIMRLDSSVLNESGVLITDRNASCQDAKFFRPHQWSLCGENAAYIFERHSYSNNNTFARKSVRQIEVLCPNIVKASFIRGFFVKNQTDAERVRSVIGSQKLDISINSNIFFLDNSRTLNDFAPLANELDTADELIGLAALRII